MNYIGIIILSAILIEAFLNFLSEYLNLKNASPEVPDEFKDIYDDERYRKSQEYLKTNTRFNWIITIFDLSILLTFWLIGGFQILDDFVRSFNFGSVATGLFFIGIIAGIKLILSTPFSIYSTFVIEEKFGFNKTTPKTFISDTLKSVALGSIFGGIVLSLVILFFENAGRYSWLYCFITVTTIILVMQYIYPVFIMPLFNKFEDLEDGELKVSLMNYAKSINFPLTKIFKMDGSKRSSKSNAFFTGFGNNKRIVLFDTLIKNHSVEELVAVLAHEMGHYKKNHIKKMMIAGIMQMGIIFYLLSFFLSEKMLFEAFFMDKISVYAGLIFFGMLFSPISFFLNIIMQYVSRKHEYEADRFAKETSGKGKYLKKALKKLSFDNLSNLTPHPMFVFLNYSHPPVLRRIKAIDES